MKKLAIVLVVVSLLGLAQASQAVDLAAGSYADVSVGVVTWAYTSDGYQYETLGTVFFTTDSGQYGPFNVTKDLNQYHSSISVLSDYPNAVSEDSLILPLTFQNVQNGISRFIISSETNYNANAMRLEFWAAPEDGSQWLLWSQPQSGLQYSGTETISYGYPGVSYYFKVSVVPEPSSLVGLALALPGFIGFARRRK